MPDEAEDPRLEKLRSAIGSVLGDSIEIKTIDNRSEDFARARFERIISNYIFVKERETVLADYIGFSEYDKYFFYIIDDLFTCSFTPNQIKLIHFYLWDRYETKGEMKIMVDENNNEIPLDTTEDLWMVIQRFK